MSTFLPEPQFPDDLDPQSTLDLLDDRLLDPSLPPPDLVVTDTPPPPLGRSWLFDFVAQSFVKTTSGIAETRGLATLRVWIEKCMRTERGAHPIYSDDFGIVRPFDIIGMQLSEISKEDLQQRITDALTLHPSILDVQDFDMTYDTDGDDALFVSFTVILTDQRALVVSNVQLP